MTDIHTIAWWTSLAALSAASAIDLRTRRIPNWLSVPFLVGGFVAQGLWNGWGGIAMSAGGALLAVALRSDFAPVALLALRLVGTRVTGDNPG